MKKIIILLLVLSLFSCRDEIPRPPLHVEFDFNPVSNDSLTLELINLSENYDSLQWIIWNLDTFYNYSDTFYYKFPEEKYYSVELNGWQSREKQTYRLGIKPGKQ